MYINRYLDISKKFDRKLEWVKKVKRRGNIYFFNLKKVIYVL